MVIPTAELTWPPSLPCTYACLAGDQAQSHIVTWEAGCSYHYMPGPCAIAWNALTAAEGTKLHAADYSGFR